MLNAFPSGLYTFYLVMLKAVSCDVKLILPDAKQRPL